MRHLARAVSLTAALLALSSAAAAQPPVLDGLDIPNDFGPGTLLATQRFQTQFGDDVSGDQFGFGSELDQMFVTNDRLKLYIGITGNLENNGNCLVIFFDVDGPASGANSLATQDGLGTPVAGLPRYLAGPNGPGLNGLTFDAGFAPDYALGFSGGSPLGSQTQTYYVVNWTSLDPVSGGLNHSNLVLGLMTAGNPRASGTAGTLGPFLDSLSSSSFRGTADNSNDNGVDGGSNVTAIDPATATKGFELAVPLGALGVDPGDSVCLFAMVSSPNGFMSNQLLPTETTSPAFTNLGFPPFDFGLLSGDQFVCYTVVDANCPLPGCDRPNGIDVDIDGDCDVDLSDLAVLLANFGATVPPFEDGDTDGTPTVNLADLANLLARFGSNCN